MTAASDDASSDAAAKTANNGARVDLLLIASMVDPNTRVLDVGCGEGLLLEMLRDDKNCDARGIELSRDGVSRGVARGLAIIQGDADADLADYPDDSFDYVILSQTIQATRNPRHVLEELLRIGKRVIVSFPNFAHWRLSMALLFTGRMPRSYFTLQYSQSVVNELKIAPMFGIRWIGAQVALAVAVESLVRTPW